MARLFLPDAERAYTRSVLFAVELLDAVTLLGVSREVRVSAPPLRAQPIVNFSGRFVWLQEGATRPQKVMVDPGELPYEREELPAPVLPPDLNGVPETARLLQVLLRPRRGYVFPDGVTVVRGRLNESTAQPPAAVSDAAVWLQWFDDEAQHWQGDRARTFVRTQANGEFAAFLRLGPAAKPLRDKSGRMQVRLRVGRPNVTDRIGTTLDVREGRIFNDFQTLAWSDLRPA